MKTKIITLIILWIVSLCSSTNALTLAPGPNHFSCIAVHEGKIAWCDKTTMFFSTVDTFPAYTKYEMDDDVFYGCNRLEWSGNGKVLYATKANRLIRFRYAGGKLKQDPTFIDGKISSFHLLPNMNGTKVVVAFDGECTATRNPGWRAGAELEFCGDSYKTTSVFTDQAVGSSLGNMFSNKHGDIYFSVYTEHRDGYYLHYKIKSGENIKKFHKCGPMRLQDVSPSGGRLLLSGPVKNLKSKSGNPLLSLFMADVKGDVVGTPKAILIPHEDPILWHSQFADDETIIWVDLVRGEDGNQIIKRSVSLSQYTDSKWTRPSVLFDIPNHQVSGISASKNVIALVNYKKQVIVFDRSSIKPTAKVIQMEL